MTTDTDITNAASALGRKGGKARTEAKQAASRNNGKRGGRPRKMLLPVGMRVEVWTGWKMEPAQTKNTGNVVDASQDTAIIKLDELGGTVTIVAVIE